MILFGRGGEVMKFGALSEKEVEKITALLETESIPYEVTTDESIENFNARSMDNDLRHLSPPNISTHILAIVLEDESFKKMGATLKEKLLEFGITDETPDLEDFEHSGEETHHKTLLRGPQVIAGANLKHQIVVFIVLTLLYLIYRAEIF